MRIGQAGLLLASSLAVACASGDDEPVDERVEARHAICDAYCAGLGRCGYDALGCANDCFTGYDPPGVRPLALQSSASCVRALPCRELTGDTPFKSCFEAFEADPILSDRLIEYCQSASRHYFECNAWWSVDACVHDMSIWSDEVLTEAMACHGKACDDLPACEESVFEAYL